MSIRTAPPFRADHVGSLLRPAELLAAREEHAAGRLDDEGLRAAEDAAIRDVVRMQHDVGLRTVTDGEFRRASWHMDFIYSLGGISKAPGDLHVQFRNERGTIEFTPAAGGRRSTRRSTRTSTPSGRTSPPPTPTRSARCSTSAAATCSSTTPR